MRFSDIGHSVYSGLVWCGEKASGSFISLKCHFFRCHISLPRRRAQNHLFIISEAMRALEQAAENNEQEPVKLEFWAPALSQHLGTSLLVQNSWVSLKLFDEERNCFQKFCSWVVIHTWVGNETVAASTTLVTLCWTWMSEVGKPKCIVWNHVYMCAQSSYVLDMWMSGDGPWAKLLKGLFRQTTDASVLWYVYGSALA